MEENAKKTRKTKPKQPYKCPRCGYETTHKPDMRKHLYTLKKECPGLINDIELTEEIKQKILKNRVYQIPKETKPVAPTKIINNYNTMNNFISSIDAIEKFEKYSKFKDIEITGLEFDVNEKYSKEITKLENDRYKYGIHLKDNDILEIIDNISKVSSNFEDFNILYNAEKNKINLYTGNWSALLIDIGIKQIIQIIQDSYLYAYEKYLIKKIFGGSPLNLEEKNKCRLSLEEYFRFMNIFDIKPYCIEKTDNEILDKLANNDNENDSYNIEEKISKIYNESSIKQSDKNRIMKTVKDIIKANSKNSVKELNKKVLSLLNVNDEFKSEILNAINEK